MIDLHRAGRQRRLMTMTFQSLNDDARSMYPFIRDPLSALDVPLAMLC